MQGGPPEQGKRLKEIPRPAEYGWFREAMDTARRPRRLELHLRLEDAVAGLFFVIFLIVLVTFHVNGGNNLGPATEMALAGVVALCLKQLIEQALSKKEYRVGEVGAWEEFTRPYGRIARDWFPFVLILMMYYSLYGDATHLLVRQDQDAWLIAADLRLFGFEPSLAIQRWITPRADGLDEIQLWDAPALHSVGSWIYLRAAGPG